MRSGADNTLVPQGRSRTARSESLAAYVSRHGHAFIDRALYLPKEWTDDPDRLEAAYVPPDAGFATKPKLATKMIARAMAASVPFKWLPAIPSTVLAISNSNYAG